MHAAVATVSEPAMLVLKNRGLDMLRTLRYTV